MRRAPNEPGGSAVELRCQPAPGGDLGQRRAEPVTCGVPWPRGEISDPSRLVLLDERGSARPCQVRVLDRWSDGSARWCLLDWQADVAEPAVYRLAASGTPRVDFDPVRAALSDGARRLVVDSGAARFESRAGGRFPFDSVTVGGRPAVDSRRSAFVARDAAGDPFEVRIDAIDLLEEGPIRAAARLRGRLVSRDERFLADVETELHFHAGSATVRVVLTLTNPRPAAHPGGIWTLGRRGSIYLRDAALTLTLPDAAAGEASIACSEHPGRPHEAVSAPLELYQDSSGGDNWKSSVHVNREGRVPNRFRGYRLRAGGAERSGDRATPVVTLDRGDRHLGLAMRHFWQNFPKAVEAGSDSLTLRLFPAQYADVHEIQGGERKSHTFHLAFARDRVTESPLAWCREPLEARAEPDWYARSEAMPFLVPAADDPNRTYLELAGAALDGADTFERKRERVDEYGWRHFGDLWGDHEAVRHPGPEPLVSHYNNQYDALAGFAVQFMRSGDFRWFRQLDELALHVIDIDRYHTDGDKSAYNRGMFWHTAHYVDAGTSTHRSYPPHEDVPGGGPSAGQLYTTGLMLHYLLTGNRSSLEAAVGLGQYVIDADDGAKSVFRFLDRGPTGHVTLSAWDDYHGPGRSAANSLNALIDAHRLDGGERFLEKAEELIRRTIHPRDDLAARDLLNAESRWFYTMFLQSLGRYLDHKAELGQLDEMYAYARSSLLRYATWAANHEYPYLDRPEILEFPTETWAAQDMRKSELFKIASRHADPPARERFLERARFFFDASVNRLAGMETRTLCRPVVLMLTNGYAQACFDLRRPAPAPPPAEAFGDFGRPAEFVPQKRRVKRKLIGLAAALLVAGALAALALLAS